MTNDNWDIRSASDLEDALYDLFSVLTVYDCDDDESSDIPYELRELDYALTYRQADVLTNDAGLVLRMQSGDEYQLTIVKSK